MKLQTTTPILDLHRFPAIGISARLSRRLAESVAAFAFKPEIAGATVADLLNYFPMRYEDRSNLVRIDELSPNVDASVELYVRVSGGYRVGKNRSAKAPPLFIFEINAADAERLQRPVVVWWFVSGRTSQRIIQYYQERFARGVRFVAFGRWEWDSRRGTLAMRVARADDLEILPPVGEAGEGLGSFDAEDLDEDRETPGLSTIHTGRGVPVYRKLGNFRTKRIRELIFCILREMDRASVTDSLPADLLERNELIARADAFSGIHFPPENSRISEYQRFRSPAQRRLIFEEFFWLNLLLGIRRQERLRETKSARFNIGPTERESVLALSPFKLTGAQIRTIDEIFADMNSGSPMNRLVQGDVGSGKTIVALLAVYAAVRAGYQAAIMVPTEILAEQHGRNAAALFAGTPYRVGLITGSLKAAEKRRIRAQIAAGDVSVIIGTHAVIQDSVTFSGLGLAVIDEQHRFGVMQRAELKSRGLDPDVLVMTATPIPRSLAMTIYGDLDVSLIDELPPGRTPVKTVVVGEDRRRGVYRGIEREIEKGRQVYVVYPLVAESERSDLKAATKMFEELRDRDFPHRRVGLIHGRLKAPEKEATMTAFARGEIDILVSTTVIEVGVDVPNASLMIVEHAERFGLSQLHQLRGRVGRGADESFCVLLSADRQTSQAIERLGIMEETSDGFRIAEKDLEIRGEGEILGTRQAGLRAFRLANMLRDRGLLERARAEALRYAADATGEDGLKLRRIIASDPRFRLGDVG
jgi:ATP-dependent DNA helicase RecG